MALVAWVVMATMDGCGPMMMAPMVAMVTTEPTAVMAPMERKDQSGFFILNLCKGGTKNAK